VAVADGDHARLRQRLSSALAKLIRGRQRLADWTAVSDRSTHHEAISLPDLLLHGKIWTARLGRTRRPLTTRSGPRSLLRNVLLPMLEKHHPAGSEEHRRYEA